MALVLADRVKESTSTVGTGSLTLAGAASGFQSFGTAIGDTNTTYYAITEVGGAAWEVGIGTYTASGTVLSRDTVLASSNSGSLVNFTSGTKDVFAVYPAGRAVVVSGSTVQIPNSATVPVASGGTGASTAANALLNLGLTATAAELNVLDGITASIAELNILDGVTATASELNVLDGITATTAELNTMDGVTATASELNVLDGITATTAELNIMDGVTATALELNTLDGITATTTELNYVDGVTSNVQTQIDSANANALAFAIALG